MYLFDEHLKDYVESIIKDKSKISIEDRFAEQKMQTMADYYANTQYNNKRILENMRDIFSNYFIGKNKDYQDRMLQSQIDKAKNKNRSNYNCQNIGTPIYQSELDIIESLPNQHTKQLAFSYLFMSKYIYYKTHQKNPQRATHWIFEQDADIYLFAGLDDYDYDKDKKVYMKKNRVSSAKKTEMIEDLFERGLIDYRTHYNSKSKHKPELPFHYFKYKVLFKNVDVESEQPVFTIDKYFDYKTYTPTALLYFLRWQGNKDIKTCERCGCPIIKTVNNRKYCISCARDIKNNRSDYK